MTTVSLQEAQRRLAELVGELAPGDEVVITHDDRPVAKLVGQSPSVAPTAGGSAFMARVNGEFDRLANLPSDWDLQGAKPISSEIIAAARQLAASISDQVSALPAVVPMGKGNLQFEWNHGPRSLELEVESPSTIHFLKWHPEEGVEDEGVYDIADVARSVELVRWFQQGVDRFSSRTARHVIPLV
jgi:antitoxin (DNA-binding transcriptional repressor) of toxin-antitoxin stability system